VFALPLLLYKVLVLSLGMMRTDILAPFYYLPVNLWRRDILQEMGTILYNPSAKVSHMMLQQGFDPHKGLGKSQQGIKEPMSSMPHPPTHF
jgi:hypothetical protein